jgi:DNA-binding NarL/FixJ family response regulator
MLALPIPDRSAHSAAIPRTGHVASVAPQDATAVILGFDSPTLLCGLEVMVAKSSDMRLAASAQCLQNLLSACSRLGTGVAIVDPSLARQSSMRDFLDSLRLAAPNVRIILLTDEHQPHKVREALRHGARGLVDKAASPDAIRSAIAAVAAGQRYISPSISSFLADSLTLQSLTEREMDVLALLCRGHCNKTIANDLVISLGTVKTHVRAVMGKLHSRSRTEAVMMAYRLGLVDLWR